MTMEEALLDLHIHTIYSDGLATPNEVIKYAKIRGLRVISITDHNSIAAYNAIDKSNDILIIYGVELDTPQGHLLVYMDSLDPNVLSITHVEDLLDYIKQNDYLTSIAHPYGKFLIMPFNIIKSDLINNIDAIEVINGRLPFISNLKAYKLAIKISKNITGGSDAHLLSEVGRVGLICYENIETYDDLISAIKHGRVKVYGTTRSHRIIWNIIKSNILRITRSLAY